MYGPIHSNKFGEHRWYRWADLKEIWRRHTLVEYWYSLCAFWIQCAHVMCPPFGRWYRRKLHICVYFSCPLSNDAWVPFWRNYTQYLYNDYSNAIDGLDAWFPGAPSATWPRAIRCPCPHGICHSPWHHLSNRQQQIGRLRWPFHVLSPRIEPQTRWYCPQWLSHSWYKPHLHDRNPLRCRRNHNFCISNRMPWLDMQKKHFCIVELGMGYKIAGDFVWITPG